MEASMSEINPATGIPDDQPEPDKPFGPDEIAPIGINGIDDGLGPESEDEDQPRPSDEVPAKQGIVEAGLRS
jgi:hypothetical protein